MNVVRYGAWSCSTEVLWGKRDGRNVAPPDCRHSPNAGAVQAAKDHRSQLRLGATPRHQALSSPKFTLHRTEDMHKREHVPLTR